jgi:hypothetical protein
VAPCNVTAAYVSVISSAFLSSHWRSILSSLFWGHCSLWARHPNFLLLRSNCLWMYCRLPFTPPACLIVRWLPSARTSPACLYAAGQVIVVIFFFVIIFKSSLSSSSSLSSYTPIFLFMIQLIFFIYSNNYFSYASFKCAVKYLCDTYVLLTPVCVFFCLVELLKFQSSGPNCVYATSALCGGGGGHTALL